MSTAFPARALRQVADLPCPRGLPLLGNLLQLSPPRLHLILERWAAELGAPYRFQVGSIPITIWTDPELVQQIMRERPHRFRRYQPIEAVFEEMGFNGLFSAEGVAWEPQRKLVMQALSIPNIKAFYPTLADITGRLHARWQRAAERGEIVEMTDDLKRYTVDVTSALAFGEDPRTLERDRDVIQEHLERILPGVMSRTNALFPYWRYVRLPSDRKLERSLAQVHRHADAMMARARERMRDEPAQTPRNLLEAMLAQQQAQDGTATITDAQIRANVLTLLLAGEDTTADSIAWTLPYLAADAPLQRHLGDEAQRVLGASPVCPDYATLKALDIFEAICIEATRLRPVASVHSFEPLEDVVVGDVALPKGTRMFFVARPAMLDAKHFADPQRYDPWRWMKHAGRESDEKAHDVRAYLQFGAGPRVCPGRHLATVEMRLALSMLMKSFTIELAIDPAKIQEVQAFTMVPDTMPARLTKRAGC
ncbi:cytochrome P450 [Paraburkholderia lycopersici]|uniref:Cytochrome P450 n=1 Tax=Paraburkholderia lycopersici TaxID=416944 RepID=A0A1G6IZN9_9BURK|nr:cytochrome P450 [Paraburkholderia lycopersici]SDC11954.1 Cytochrome P450 [Paraburkholderia lycopersici]